MKNRGIANTLKRFLSVRGYKDASLTPVRLEHLDVILVSIYADIERVDETLKIVEEITDDIKQEAFPTKVRITLTITRNQWTWLVNQSNERIVSNDE